ncbi:phage tail protein I [Pseudomonas guariconensis]|uniref:phage tail protein I n=1 Tax=Pseudomonas TaxID=286 RepID=UPI0008A23F4A|nr:MULTISPECIES: phage tail protein I [Pseudomonas]MCO7620243.1 phage tail protein I [Pseudomonas guariconensis]MDD2089060.1 phage tail protein I [Pseudomonas guariconensis]MDM9592848.1 phage tail protein I [Pseudomonas guariconensis]MDM9605675.1 phage tail protein I [Pseudomonas guariconensis]MDM9610632.1 phage tail protein I [Pseudomonas guariconensis]
MPSLLPLNQTPLERAIERAGEEDLSVDLRLLYSPDNCPSHLLYQLAWTWSVDRWDDGWSDTIKRAVIRSAFFVHAHKGTLGALRRVVEPFGYLIEVKEWWESEPPEVPGTFALMIGVSDAGIDEDTYEQLSSLIDDARPVSRHLTGLTISLESRGEFHFGCACQDGDELDIYPLAERDLEVVGLISRGGREHTIDTLDIAHG